MKFHTYIAIYYMTCIWFLDHMAYHIMLIRKDGLPIRFSFIFFFHAFIYKFEPNFMKLGLTVVWRNVRNGVILVSDIIVQLTYKLILMIMKNKEIIHLNDGLVYNKSFKMPLSNPSDQRLVFFNFCYARWHFIEFKLENEDKMEWMKPDSVATCDLTNIFFIVKYRFG